MFRPPRVVFPGFLAKRKKERKRTTQGFLAAARLILFISVWLLAVCWWQSSSYKRGASHTRVTIVVRALACPACKMVRRTIKHNPAFGVECDCCPPGGLSFLPAHAKLQNQVIPARLAPAQRVAFLMGASNTSAPRLAEECVRPLRCLPLEAIRRIFELCEERRALPLARRPPPRLKPAAPRHGGLGPRNPRDPLVADDIGLGARALAQTAAHPAHACPRPQKAVSSSLQNSAHYNRCLPGHAGALSLQCGPC